MRKTMLFVALVMAVGVAVQAQRGQGRRAPAPVKQHTFDLESSYPRFPLSSENQAYGRIDGDNMKQFVNEVTAISRKDRDSGNRYWGRLPGTASDKMVEQFVASKFREWGLQDVRLQSFELPPQWFATDWALTATGSGATLSFKTVYPAQRSASTPASGLDLDIAWVGLGNELDFIGRDVKGKLAFIHSEPRPNGLQNSARFNGALQRAADKGAAAVLVNIAIPGNVTNSIGAGPRVPMFAIGSDEASELKALMVKGPVRAHARLLGEERSGLTDANVWGTLLGTTAEEIIVMAHHDGYFEAALDNASGTATMLGLAEYFAKIPQANRRRAIRFVSTGAHMSAARGTQLIHDERETLLANSVLVINCEHTSITQMNQFGPAEGDKWPEQGSLRKTTGVNARQWWVNGSDRLASIVFNAYKAFGVTIWNDAMYDGGNMGAISRDLPSVQTIVSPVYSSSDHDRADIVPPSGLEAVARAYAKIIDQVNGLDRGQIGSTAAVSQITQKP